MASDEALALLRSIDASLKQIAKGFQDAKGKPIATDRDLDGKYGDPVLKVVPRDWTGAPYKGRKYSECPADLLDLVAEMQDYFGDKAEQANERTNSGKPKADFCRADAARARGWAKRIRDGKHAVEAPAAAAPAGGWGARDDNGDEMSSEWN